MSETREAAEVGTSDASSNPPATSQQGTQLPWNFDDNIEDKNPFSEFSEEHLNKLDEVLSSVEVRELLQQSTTPELGILSMDDTGLDGAAGSAGAASTSGTARQQGSQGSEPSDVGDAAGTSEQDDGESLPESVISAVFSDHGYAINPERAPKTTKPAMGTSLLPTATGASVMMDVGADLGDSPVIGLAPDGSLLKDEVPVPESRLMEELIKPVSPYSTASPRKSGRAPTRNRYLDDDWVTASPSRGRGRGRGVSPQGPLDAFGLRASTRISDQKQRDLAEKILQANRQAMEAEKQTDSPASSPDSKGKGRGKKEPEEVPVIGRGRGKGRRGRAAGKSSQEDTTENDEDESQKSDHSESEEEMETVESESDKGTKAKTKAVKGKKKKKVGKYEQDSDFSEEETKKVKGKKGKKKGKGGVEKDTSDSETVKKKGKTKGKAKEESDDDSKPLKGKKKKEEMDDESEEDTKTKKGKKSEKKEESEDESEEEAKPKKGKKKKLSLKAKKKLKGKKKKAGKDTETADDESEIKDSQEEETKPTKTKSPKKLSKKERLKKIKEAKEAKKKKLLEKKKEKLKAAKNKKRKGDEEQTTEAETSDAASPAKKKKKVGEKVEVARSPARKAKAAAEAKLESPGLKKKGKAVGKGGNKRKDEASEPEAIASPAKKAKVVKGKEGKGKREVSDSEEDVPLKKIKTDLKEASTKEQPKPPAAKKKPDNEVAKATKSEQNIFSALAEMTSTKETPVDSNKTATDVGKSVKAEPKKVETKAEAKTKSDEIDSKQSVKSSGSGEKLDADKDSVGKAGGGVKAETEADVETKSEKGSEEGSVKASTDSESKDTLKEHDSKDTHSHHHHHHHHHRRHSHDSHRDSVSSEDRRHSRDRRESVTDSHKDSHSHRKDSDSHSRRDSKDKKESHHRRGLHDRRDSHTKDKDRRGSESKDRRDRTKPERKDSKDRRDSVKERDKKSDKGKERRESTASVASNTDDKAGKAGTVVKKGAKDAKGKHKKAKKEEMPVDSSMIDLFKPDNLPTPAKEELPEIVQEPVRESKVKFKDEKSDSKVKFKDEKEKSESKVKIKDEKDVSKVKFKDDKEIKESKVKFDDEKKESSVQSKDENNFVDIETVTDSTSEKDNKLEEKENKSTSEDSKSSIEKDPQSVSVDSKDVVKDVAKNVLDKSADTKPEIPDDKNTEDKVLSSEITSAASAVGSSDTKPVVGDTLVDTKRDTEEGGKGTQTIVKDTTKESVTDKKTETVVSEPVSATKKTTETTKETKGTKETNKETKETNTDIIKDPGISKEADKAKVEPVAKEQEKAAPTIMSPKAGKPPIKQKLNISDFFTEKRLKINDPKPKVVKVVKEVVPEPSSEEEPAVTGGDGELKRSKRNKAVAFAEILKKEKLGSDDEEEDEEEEFEDDENDEDFEDPDKLYCICRQPHNQRFMICCDKCEEWFHGKCVGISRARGQQMEENNEEYMCPQCSEADEDATAGTGADISTSDAAEKDAADLADGKERTSLFDSLAADSKNAKQSKPDSTDEKEVTSTVKSPSSKIVHTTKDGKPTKHATPTVKHTPTSKQATPSSKQATPSSKQTPPSSKQATPTSQKGGEKKSSPLGKIRKKTSDSDLSEKRKRTIKMFKEGGGDSPTKKPSKCVQCSARPVRSGSLYCSSECQTKHTKEPLVKPVSILKVTYAKPKKKDKEKHVAVVERGTGKTLTGDKAPTESELKQWLAEHPTYEVLKSHRRPESKTTSSSSPAVKKTDSKDAKPAAGGKDDAQKSRGDGPEPIRLNVRKGLRDALAARVDAADDIMLSNSEIKGLALSIEEELYRYFKDSDSKYKAKYRSLIFNIKDQKNNGLFRKILGGRIRPSKLVRMSADELASKELAQWREQETKHTIEMIKQTEAELLKEQTHVTKKTHKGEVEVEGEDGPDMSSLVEEPKKEQPKPTTAEPSKADLLAELLPDTTDMHGKHLFDANCKICTGKLAPTVENTPSKTTTVVKTETAAKKEDEEPEKELTKQERDLQAEEVVKEVLKAIQRAKADAKKEEQEAQLQSAVTVRSPDSALSSGLDKKSKFTPSGPMLWKGFVYMQDVSKFVTTAYRVGGPADNLHLPDTITVCGRINPEHVWDYLSKVKQAASRDICVIRFIPGPGEEKAAYINLYSYLNSRSRCGVVEHAAKHIKDFYIVPLASHSKIPQTLLPFDGPGLEENRCHMLLGLIIRNKSHKSSSLDLPSSSSSKSSSRSSSKSSSRSSKSRSSVSRPAAEALALKSALKDPSKTAAKREKAASDSTNDSEKTSSASTPDKSSSTSSTPLTGSSSNTPVDKKKSISFDPIVKEYSHVSETDEAYEPGGDDPLGLNAPYDPEKESLKPKKEPKSDTVSLMIEKIALSKNPAEATAAMVTALATSSKIGNQRKLLMELTKKVDEQKKLLEKKRLTSKIGESPKSGASPGSSGSPKTSSLSKKKGKAVSSKDPRIRAAMAKKASEEATAAAAAETAGTSSPAPSAPDAMDVDMRLPSPHRPPGHADPRLRALAKPETLPTTPPPAIITPCVNTTPVGPDLSTSDTHSKDKVEITSGLQPTGFYVDHHHSTSKSSSDHDQAKTTSELLKAATEVKQTSEKLKLAAAASVTATEAISDKSSSNNKTSGWTPVSSDKSSSNNTASGWTEVSKQTEQEKPISIMQMLKEKQALEQAKTKTESADKPGKDDASEVSNKSNQEQSNVASDNVASDESKKAGHDIVSQIQAEISGKPVETVKDTSSKTDTTKTTEGKTDALKKAVPNVTSLLKNLASASATGAGQAGVQLPTALMSLFSSLPGTEEEEAPATETGSKPALAGAPKTGSGSVLTGAPKTGSVPTGAPKTGSVLTGAPKTGSSSALAGAPQTGSSSSLQGVPETGTSFALPVKAGSAELEPVSEEQVPQDVDMRDPAAAARMVPSFEAFGQTGSSSKSQPAKPEKDETEKLSKNFMGFEYDSDSSDGSFEGFDDDGTKKLSPRKRKLVGKAKAAGKVSGSAEGVMEDVDLRNVQRSDTGVTDVDERLNSAGDPSLLDVDHRQLPLPPPPPNVRLPFVSPNQPPPPGEEWDTGAVEIPPPVPQVSMDDWTQGPLGVPQPPLPAEPPTPKPPEPPKKKDKNGKSDKESGKGKKKKNKSALLQSDVRLNEIVMKIANKESSTPLSSAANTAPAPMPYSRRPHLLPMPGPPPIIQSASHPPPILPPVMDHSSGVDSSGWMGGPAPPPMLNTQSPMVPPVLPPQLQPGVAMPQTSNSPNLGPPPLPNMPPPNIGPPPNVGPPPNMGGPGPGPSNPPSLLDLPTPPKHSGPRNDGNFDPMDQDFGPPPILQPEFAGRHHGGGRRGYDESDRRRHDRYRERSGERDYDRHRSRDYHRDRDGHRDSRGHGNRGHRDDHGGRRDSDRERRHKRY